MIVLRRFTSLGLEIGYEEQLYCQTAAKIAKLTHDYYHYINVVEMRYHQGCLLRIVIKTLMNYRLNLRLIM